MTTMNDVETQESKTVPVYREELEAQLEQIDFEIAKWRQEWSESSDDVRVINFEDIIDRLTEERNEILQKLHRLNIGYSEKSDNIWDGLKQGLDNAWNDIKHTFDEATARFRQDG